MNYVQKVRHVQKMEKPEYKTVTHEICCNFNKCCFIFDKIQKVWITVIATDSQNMHSVNRYFTQWKSCIDFHFSDLCTKLIQVCCFEKVEQ